MRSQLCASRAACMAGRRLHALENRVQPPALQFGRNQQRVIHGILDHQDSQRTRHNIIVSTGLSQRLTYNKSGSVKSQISHAATRGSAVGAARSCAVSRHITKAVAKPIGSQMHRSPVPLGPLAAMRQFRCRLSDAPLRAPAHFVVSFALLCGYIRRTKKL